jgi:hypothetical protein
MNRPILNPPWILIRDLGALPIALGHLPAVTLRAAPGFALPGITPAHPPRLLDHRRGPGSGWPPGGLSLLIPVMSYEVRAPG